MCNDILLIKYCSSIPFSKSSLYIPSKDNKVANKAAIQIEVVAISFKILSDPPKESGKVSKQRRKKDNVNHDLVPSDKLSLKSLQNIV